MKGLLLERDNSPVTFKSLPIGSQTALKKMLLELRIPGA